MMCEALKFLSLKFGSMINFGEFERNKCNKTVKILASEHQYKKAALNYFDTFQIYSYGIEYKFYENSNKITYIRLYKIKINIST